jgi:hypothetical protein
MTHVTEPTEYAIEVRQRHAADTSTTAGARSLS